MGCFNLAWLETLLIWLVVVGAIVALVRLVLPIVVGPLGPHGVIVSRALNIIIWAVVTIAIIVVIFDLLTCFVGAPRLR